MFGWSEVFISLDETEAAKVCDMIQKNGIPCKMQSESNATRLSRNHLDGSRLPLSRDGPHATNRFYRVFVKKGFEEDALGK